MRYTLTLPFPPSTNLYWRIGNNRIHLTETAKAYKLEAGYRANAVCKKPITEEVRLTVNFYRPRAIGDTDNLLKVLLDSMSGIIYKDDRQVAEIHAYRFNDPSNPRAEVTIETIKEERP